MMVRKIIFAAALVLGVGAGSASAATFHISFDDTANGAGVDWMGSFEAPVTGGPLTSFSVEIAGVTYSVLNDLGAIAGAFPSYDSLLKVLVAVDPFSNPTVTNVPFISDALALIMTGTGVFGTGSCTESNCTASVRGTYSVTQLSAVPLPATLPLLAAALGGLALVGRRRSRGLSA